MNEQKREALQEEAMKLDTATEEIENARYAVQFLGVALQAMLGSPLHHSNPEGLSKGAAQITTWIDESLQRATDSITS